jgi:hypothetical protein
MRVDNLPDAGDWRSRCEPTATDKRPGCGGSFFVESQTGHELDTEPRATETRRGISVLLRCNQCGRFSSELFPPYDVRRKHQGPSRDT